MFKVAEDTQPVSGNQDKICSKEKENEGSVHTKEVLADFTTAVQSYLCNTEKRIRCQQQTTSKEIKLCRFSAKKWHHVG